MKLNEILSPETQKLCSDLALALADDLDQIDGPQRLWRLLADLHSTNSDLADELIRANRARQ